MKILFCVFCLQKLNVREELIDEKFANLFYYCENKNCNYKKKCVNYQIEYKKYYHNKNIETLYLNQYKAKDITLPFKKSKCPKCQKKNYNRFERKYFNHKFYINNICSECFYNW